MKNITINVERLLDNKCLNELSKEKTATRVKIFGITVFSKEVITHYPEDAASNLQHLIQAKMLETLSSCISDQIPPENSKTSHEAQESSIRSSVKHKES